MAQNSENDELDSVDRTLLTALQDDGRMGYADLGRLVNLTPGGARRRVMRLEERGIVQVVGVTDPFKLGYRNMAMLGIVVEGDVAEVADALGRIEDIVYVVVSAGSFDLLVEVVAKDSDALFDVINSKVRKVSGVARTETFMYYSIHTHRFGWGTP